MSNIDRELYAESERHRKSVETIIRAWANWAPGTDPGRLIKKLEEAGFRLCRT